MTDHDSFDFFGETFALPERIGSMPLMRFAKLAQQNVESSDVAGLAAMYDVIESCLTDEDWDRFQACAIKHRATDEELLTLVGQVMLAVAARPTPRSFDLSDGPLDIAPSSTSSPAERAIAREVGRPDVQHIIATAQEEMAAASS